MDRIQIARKIIADLNVAFGHNLPSSAVDVAIEVMKEFDSEESRPTPRAVDVCPVCRGTRQDPAYKSLHVDCPACAGTGMRR